MALESGTFISDLVVTNPTGSDALAFADDHLRLLKSTIKATFPNVTGAVTKTHTAINNIPDNTTQSIANLQASINQVSGTALALATIYPVGSVYLNATNSTNPGTLFGFGTWTAFGAGRVPVGFNSGNALFNAAEKTGGSADTVVVSHTHTATVTDPGHNHSLPSDVVGALDIPSISNSINADEGYSSVTPTGTATTGISVTNASTGVSGTNANYQPFITVYMWKRTA